MQEVVEGELGKTKALQRNMHDRTDELVQLAEKQNTFEGKVLPMFESLSGSSLQLEGLKKAI